MDEALQQAAEGVVLLRQVDAITRIRPDQSERFQLP